MRIDDIKSLSQRKLCKIVHKQGWPILIIFGRLEGLCTSIANILYFLSEIKMVVVRAPPVFSHFGPKNAIGNTRKLTHFTPLYFYNVEC